MNWVIDGDHLFAGSSCGLGRGGTDFRDVFRWVQGEANGRMTALVVATDGYGTFPSDPPGCPVIWLRTSDGLDREKFPFGAVVGLSARAG